MRGLRALAIQFEDTRPVFGLARRLSETVNPRWRWKAGIFC